MKYRVLCLIFCCALILSSCAYKAPGTVTDDNSENVSAVNGNDDNGLLYGLYDPDKVYVISDHPANRHFAENAGVQLINDLPAKESSCKSAYFGTWITEKKAKIGKSIDFLGNNYENLKYVGTHQFVFGENDVSKVKNTDDEFLKTCRSYDEYSANGDRNSVIIGTAEETNETVYFSLQAWDDGSADAGSDISPESAKEAAVSAAKSLGRETEGYLIEVEKIDDVKNKNTDKTYTGYSVTFKKQYSDKVYTGYSFTVVNGGRIIFYGAYLKWYAPVPSDEEGNAIIPADAVRKAEKAKAAFKAEYLPYDTVSYGTGKSYVARFGEDGALSYVETVFYSGKPIVEISVLFVVVLPENYAEN